MTPRELLLNHARQNLRWARQAQKSIVDLLVRYPHRPVAMTEHLVETQLFLMLHNLGHANALRAFAQRRLPDCEECSGNGFGSSCERISAGLSVVRHNVPRGCTACLGGGSKLPSQVW